MTDLGDRINRLWDDVFEAVQEGTITREFGDRILGHIAEIKSATLATGPYVTPPTTALVIQESPTGRGKVRLDRAGLDIPTAIDDIFAAMAPAEIDGETTDE